MLNTGSQNGICVYVCSYAKGSGVMPFTTSVFDVETSLQKLSRKKKKKDLMGFLLCCPHMKQTLYRRSKKKLSLMNLMDAHINAMQREQTTKQIPNSRCSTV